MTSHGNECDLTQEQVMNLGACSLFVSFHFRIYSWFPKMTLSETHIEEFGEIMYIFRNQAQMWQQFCWLLFRVMFVAKEHQNIPKQC